ncbi:hypothetical protein LBW56_08825, partial [Ralstonia solanacearum]|uniref:hypothetical protein n=1 Tax=Ralstonia solanacearum TaxID=305 RepID=UPI002304F0A9
ALTPGLHDEGVDKVRHPSTEGVEADRLQQLLPWPAFVDLQNSIDKQCVRIRSRVSCRREEILVNDLKKKTSSTASST